MESKSVRLVPLDDVTKSRDRCVTQILFRAAGWNGTLPTTIDYDSWWWRYWHFFFLLFRAGYLSWYPTFSPDYVRLRSFDDDSQIWIILVSLVVDNQQFSFIWTQFDPLNDLIINIGNDILSGLSFRQWTFPQLESCAPAGSNLKKDKKNGSR